MTPITLLVPCYNAAQFLPRLMESVRAQAQPFAAIICYDDGSTDLTVAVARELGVEIITGQPNRGAAHARNALAAAAPTDWIHFHDADDLLTREFLAQLAPWCDEQHDIVSCDADWLEEDSRRLLLAWRYDPAALQRDPHSYLVTHPMSLNNTVIRRSSWMQIGGCNEALKMWEDADVHVRLAREGARFRHVSKVLTHALRRSHSFSHDYRQSWRCRLDALEGYAADGRGKTIADALASEAERAATELAILGLRPETERALRLCRQFGRRPPTTAHFALRLLKPLLPAYVLLRWQALHRARPHTTPASCD